MWSQPGISRRKTWEKVLGNQGKLGCKYGKTGLSWPLKAFYCRLKEIVLMFKGLSFVSKGLFFFF